MVWAFYVNCECGCGCKHFCAKKYGPYFAMKRGKKTVYLGRLLSAKEKGFQEEALAFCAKKSAISLKKKGFEVMTIYERKLHLIEEHNKKIKVIKEMRNCGLSYREIASKLSLNKGQVWKLLNLNFKIKEEDLKEHSILKKYLIN